MVERKNNKQKTEQSIFCQEGKNRSRQYVRFYFWESLFSAAE